mmetsp:Transcript_64369/g.140127  ORF Transcript_64369/g.140127 Transcript_64369/m.140127 type:complete len:280 (+) Transcript_64369:139-978(+)
MPMTVLLADCVDTCHLHSGTGVSTTASPRPMAKLSACCTTSRTLRTPGTTITELIGATDSSLRQLITPSPSNQCPSLSTSTRCWIEQFMLARRIPRWTWPGKRRLADSLLSVLMPTFIGISLSRIMGRMGSVTMKPLRTTDMSGTSSTRSKAAASLTTIESTLWATQRGQPLPPGHHSASRRKSEVSEPQGMDSNCMELLWSSLIATNSRVWATTAKSARMMVFKSQEAMGPAMGVSTARSSRGKSGMSWARICASASSMDGRTTFDLPRGPWRQCSNP